MTNRTPDVQAAMRLLHAILDAFKPVADWYLPEGDERNTELLPQAIENAVADLQADRKQALRMRELEAENAKWRSQLSDADDEHEELQRELDSCKKAVANGFMSLVTPLQEQLASAERVIVNIRRVGRTNRGDKDRIINMRSIACRYEVDESNYPKTK